MARSKFDQVATPLDLSLTAGDDWGVQITFTSGGTPINLAGYTFAANVYNGATVLQAITVTTTDLPNGVIDLSLSDTETSALGRGRWMWSLQYTNGSDTFTPVGGRVTLRAKAVAA
jgi:hypothetical protein